MLPKENLFGQSALLMYAISIVFFKVIYKFMEWSLHPEWTFEILSLQKQLSGRVL